MSDVKPLDTGVTTSLDRMYRRHAGWLQNRLKARVGHDEAGDVVQETYLRILPYLLDDIRHPKALLLRVALNLVRDGKRRSARHESSRSVEFAVERAGADAPSAHLQVKQILQTMPALCRDVFVMSRFDGMSYAAIASAHGISLATVERRMAKGVGVVIPNLLAWPHAVVALDIKRENFDATAGYRAEAGQRVLMFDPLALDGRTARFNPLGHVDRTDPVAVLDELQRMAAMLFPAHDQADPFWSEAARTGFIGVGAYVAASPPLPFTLGEIFRQLTEDDPRRRFPKAIEARRRQGDPLPQPCVSALNDFCSSSENTFASIRQSITTRMGLWLNPAVDAATSASDFDLRDLRQGRMSLYLGTTPDNLLRVAPLYSLLFQQLIDLNSRALPGADDRPVLVLLDEFARLGPAPVLAHAFSWVAGYGLRLLPVIQSPSQLRGLYGPDLAEAILTNCGVEVVFAPKELKVAQELSERLGAYTYAAHSRSRPRGLGLGRRTITASDQRRPLMLPQELTQMPASALLVFKAGLPPVRGAKIAYYREAVFRRRLRAPPSLPAAPPPGRPAAPPLSPAPAPPEESDMEFDAIVRAFAEEGLPPPDRGASEGEVRDWLDRVTAAEPAAVERQP